MAQTKYEEVGSVTLNSERYRLMREQGRNQSYVQGSEDEPPWAGGAPSMVSEESFTWHLGGFKSRQGVTGTSEYGKNSDGRFMFRLRPSPKLNTITLTDSAANPSSIAEAMGYVWVTAGQYVYRIDPDDDSVVESKDFGSGVTAVMALRWEQDYLLVTTDADSKSLWKCSAVDAGGDTWAQSDDVAVYRLASGINRLFGVNKSGELRNVSTGLDPLADENWADSVQCGDTATLPTALLAYERTVFVGKPEGLFGVGDDGFGLPLIRRMARHDDNCAGMAILDPWVLVPHIRGLYRFVPGIVESSGLEKEILNESPVKGQWKAFAIDGDWIYGAIAVDDETYVVSGRQRRDNEPGFGPFLWDTWLYFDATCQTAWLSALSASPRAYFGHDNNIAYVELGDNGDYPEYATSASRTTIRYRFNDWRSKDFPKVDVVGNAGLSGSIYWSVYYSIDGGSFSNLDIDGNAMKVDADGMHTFYLPTTAVGREVQFRFDYTSDDAEVAGEIIAFHTFAVPQSQKVPVVVFHLALEHGIRHDSETIETRPAIEQFNDLQALTEQATAVATYGPWGENVNAWIRSLRIVQTTQEMDEEPSFVVEVGMQLREAS